MTGRPAATTARDRRGTARTRATKTTLPCCSSALSGGSGSGRGVVPASMASDSARTRSFVNSTRWNECRSSRNCWEGACWTCAWFRSAPRRLLLERRHARVHLVAAGAVGVARPGVLPVRTGELHVVDGGHRAPHVRRTSPRTARSSTGSTSLTFAGSAKLTRIRPFWRRLLKSRRVLAVRPEVVRVDRPEERVVGVRDRTGAATAGTGTAARRWRARAGSGPSPCGSRRTSARCRRCRPGCGRRNGGGRARRHRRARRRRGRRRPSGDQGSAAAPGRSPAASSAGTPALRGPRRDRPPSPAAIESAIPTRRVHVFCLLIRCSFRGCLRPRRFVL